MEYTCREDHAGKQVPFQYIDGEYSRMTHYIKIRIYSAYTYFKIARSDSFRKNSTI